jgi:hypothetical protein
LRKNSCMPVVPWKSGALAPRKTRRINNGLQPRWSPIAAIGVFSQPPGPNITRSTNSVVAQSRFRPLCYQTHRLGRVSRTGGKGRCQRCWVP